MDLNLKLLLFITATIGASGLKNVVDIAQELGLIKLVTAINDTGLYGEWAEDEDAQLNLFGFTDEAFEEAQSAGIIPDNYDELRRILTYHAVSATRYGKLSLDAMQNDVLYETINTGDYMRLNIYHYPGHKRHTSNGALIDDNRANNDASNGMLQVIDKVLTLPQYTVYSLLENDGRFGTLLSAVNTAELQAALADSVANLTLFAPSDEAFALIPEDDLNDLLADKTALTDTLLFHAIGSTYYAMGLQNEGQLQTIQGGSLSVSKDDTSTRVNGALVVSADINVKNGVVHVIDTVLTLNSAADGLGSSYFLAVFILPILFQLSV